MSLISLLDALENANNSLKQQVNNEENNSIIVENLSLIHTILTIANYFSHNSSIHLSQLIKILFPIQSTATPATKFIGTQVFCNAIATFSQSILQRSKSISVYYLFKPRGLYRTLHSLLDPTLASLADEIYCAILDRNSVIVWFRGEGNYSILLNIQNKQEFNRTNQKYNNETKTSSLADSDSAFVETEVEQDLDIQENNNENNNQNSLNNTNFIDDWRSLIVTYANCIHSLSSDSNELTHIIKLDALVDQIQNPTHLIEDETVNIDSLCLLRILKK